MKERKISDIPVSRKFRYDMDELYTKLRTKEIREKEEVNEEEPQEEDEDMEEPKL